MSDGFLFTSESVTEGHPDKVADQISDVYGTRDEAPQQAEAKIGLVARFDSAHRDRAV